MKNPLRYQITEYDCGPTSLINAFSYLYNREEIPVTLVKGIILYTVDEYVDENNAGGTSRAAMSLLVDWLMAYAKENDFSLFSKRYEKEEVTLEGITKCIREKGTLVVRLMQEYEHYALLTDIDENFVYFFDSYYLDSPEYDDDDQVEMIFDQPFKCNRKVSIKRFMSESDEDFSLGKISNREYIVIKKGN